MGNPHLNFESFDGKLRRAAEDALAAIEDRQGFSRSAVGRTPVWPGYLDRLAGSGLKEFSVRLRSHNTNDVVNALSEVLDDEEADDPSRNA